VDVMWKYLRPAVTVVLGSYCNLKQLLNSFLVQYCIIVLNMYRRYFMSSLHIFL